MPITIDGDALTITLPAATPNLDVETDLYSEWLKWTLLGDNRRFENAFRASVAGDPLTPSLDLGAYFFFQNQSGWRLRPAEENGTVNFTGNFVPEDTTVTAVIPTIGAFTVLLLGLQPVTQKTDTLLTQSTELHRMRGLDTANPVTVTSSSEVAGDISLGITGDGVTTSTATRT